MNDSSFYFAYGSNMALKRLQSRISSAETIGVAMLECHQLKFHKYSKKDGSGKCDAAYTGNPDDKVFGVLYSFQAKQFPELDKFEGCGYGYERKSVIVHSASNEEISAETYIATEINASLHPLDWYKEHVLRGAITAGLPHDYIAQLEAVVAIVDPDEKRRATELAIYG